MDRMAPAKVNGAALNATFSGSKYHSSDSLPPGEHYSSARAGTVSKSLGKVTK